MAGSLKKSTEHIGIEPRTSNSCADCEIQEHHLGLSQTSLALARNEPAGFEGLFRRFRRFSEAAFEEVKFADSRRFVDAFLGVGSPDRVKPEEKPETTYIFKNQHFIIPADWSHWQLVGLEIIRINRAS